MVYVGVDLHRKRSHVVALGLPREAQLLAFEAGCEDYCEREVDEVEWQGGRVCLHLGVRRDDPPRG